MFRRLSSNSRVCKDVPRVLEMERAARQQRRLDQKLKGVGDKEIRGLQETASEADSVEDVLCSRVHRYMQDLESKLHVSDAKVTKWQRLAEERLERMKELDMEIDCLKEKIREITEEKKTRSAAEAQSSKLKSENRILEEKNKQLAENVELLRKNMEVLHRNGLTSMELIAQSLQVAKITQENWYQSPPETRSNKQNDVHNTQETKSVQPNSLHDSLRNKRTKPNDNCTPHETKGAQQSVHHRGNKWNTGRGRWEEDEEDIDIGGNESAGQQPDSHKVAGESSYGPVNMCASGNGTGSEEGDRSEELHRGKSEHPAGRADMWSPERITVDGEPLFTKTMASRAKEYVEQPFLKWLSTSVRRPTAKEMAYHKSVAAKSKNSPCHWTGIKSNELLRRFGEETGNDKPATNALTVVLRKIFKIEGAATRPNDMLWCLVWQDCMHLEQLPGYVLQQRAREFKRPRSTDSDSNIARSSYEDGNDLERATRQAKIS